MTSHLGTVTQPRPEASCVLSGDVRGAVDIIRVEKNLLLHSSHFALN